MVVEATLSASQNASQAIPSDGLGNQTVSKMHSEYRSKRCLELAEILELAETLSRIIEIRPVLCWQSSAKWLDFLGSFKRRAVLF